jgi:hypothetical protein
MPKNSPPQPSARTLLKPAAKIEEKEKGLKGRGPLQLTARQGHLTAEVIISDGRPGGWRVALKPVVCS